MQINFKLYATLSAYLPESAEKHTVKIDVPEETTAHKLIDEYKVPRDMAHLVLLNGVYMQPEERDQAKFKEGDTLAVWPPVAGG